MGKLTTMSLLVQLCAGSMEFMELAVGARPPAPDGKACKELTSDECCQYSDGTMYSNQDCVPAASGQKFSNDATCESSCFVDGTCGGSEAQSAATIGTCPATTTTTTVTDPPTPTTDPYIRPAAPDGQACSELSLEDCCKYADGTSYSRQNCIRASDGKKYSDGTQCQSACWVSGVCGAGDADGVAGDCGDLPQPTTDAPTTPLPTFTPRPGPGSTTAEPHTGGDGGFPWWGILLIVLGGVFVCGGVAFGIRRQALTGSIRGTELREGLNN